MGFFDAITEGNFARADSGWLFYPHGVLSRGVLIADERVYRRLRRFMRLYLYVTLAALLALGVAVGWAAALGGLLPAAAWYALAVRRLTAGLPVVAQRRGLRASYRAQAHLLSWARLCALTGGVLILGAASVWIVVVKPQEWPVAAAGLALFGAYAVLLALMLRAKWQQRSAGGGGAPRDAA